MSIGSSLISGLGSLAGGIFTASASKKAAEAQVQAQQAALAQQKQMFGEVKGALNPYITGGAENFNSLSNFAKQANPGQANLPGMTNFASIAPTINSNWGRADLEKTPGYQFTRDQALKTMANSAAARGLGSSGALVKGMGEYSAGLADQTYQQQYQNYANALQSNFTNAMAGGQQDFSNAFQLGQQNWNNQFQGNQLQGNYLQALAQMGLGAGQSLGSAAQGFSQQASNAYTNIGEAQAKGIMGPANALTGGLLGATGAYGQYSGIQAMLGALQKNSGGIGSGGGGVYY